MGCSGTQPLGFGFGVAALVQMQQGLFDKAGPVGIEFEADLLAIHPAGFGTGSEGSGAGSVGLVRGTALVDFQLVDFDIAPEDLVLGKVDMSFVAQLGDVGTGSAK